MVYLWFYKLISFMYRVWNECWFRKGRECGSLKGGITSKRMHVARNYLGRLVPSSRYYRGILCNHNVNQYARKNYKAELANYGSRSLLLLSSMTLWSTINNPAASGLDEYRGLSTSSDSSTTFMTIHEKSRLVPIFPSTVAANCRALRWLWVGWMVGSSGSR